MNDAANHAMWQGCVYNTQYVTWGLHSSSGLECIIISLAYIIFIFIHNIMHQ